MSTCQSQKYPAAKIVSRIIVRLLFLEIEIFAGRNFYKSWFLEPILQKILSEIATVRKLFFHFSFLQKAQNPSYLTFKFKCFPYLSINGILVYVLDFI